MSLRNGILKIWQKVFNRLVPQLLYFQKKYIMEQNILHWHEPGISSEKYCDHDIIASITTYGKRIYDVHLTIESLMEQTMKANRIILWLDYSFENKPLPNALSSAIRMQAFLTGWGDMPRLRRKWQEKWDRWLPKGC